MTVRLPMSKVREIITQLVENDPQNEYKWKDLSERIKTSLNAFRKTSLFRAKEWQPICNDILAASGKKLCKK